MKSPEWALHVDTKRIFATGFSYGGWTALSLAGLKGRRAGLEKFCSNGAEISSHCKDILKAGIKISNIDEGMWQASYKDPRIAAVAVIDPALTWGLNAADTKDLNVPVLLIGLGDTESRLHATDTSTTGSNFETLFPPAKVERIIPATHFTALGVCKPKGAAILAEEKDDPVCTDPAGTDRKTVMNHIIDLLGKHFGLN